MNEVRISAERLACYLGAGLLLVLAVIFLAPTIWVFLSPFLLAIPLAALFQPLTHFLERKLHLRHSAATLIPVVLIFVLVIALIYWFASFGIGQVTELLSNSDEIVEGGLTGIRAAIVRLETRLSETLGFPFQNNAAEDAENISWLTERISASAGTILSYVTQLAVQIPYAFVYVSFLAIGLYFISRDFSQLREKFIHTRLGRPDSDSGKMAHSAVNGFVGWLRVQATYALLSLIVGSIYWTILGNPYAILIAVAASILEFLPVVGNGTIYYPWAAIALLLGHYVSALEALGLFYGLLIIRRITEPKLLSHNIGIPPLLSLVSMFIGMKSGGLLGMMFSPALAALAYTFWQSQYRLTIHHDISVLRRFLHERWHPQDVQMEQDQIEQKQTPDPPPTPERKKTRSRKKEV